MNIIASNHKTCATIFSIVGRFRDNLGRVDFFLYKFELLLNLSTP